MSTTTSRTTTTTTTASSNLDCPVSLTTVNGEAVCKEQQIFDETFVNISDKTWKKDIRFAGAPVRCVKF